jgi:hypothetical protein
LKKSITPAGGISLKKKEEIPVMPDFPRTGGVTKLSELEIDTEKDWGGYRVQYLGAPIEDEDAARRVDLPRVTALEFIFDGGGSPLVGGEFVIMRVPFAGTIRSLTMLADDMPTSTTIDIQKCVYGGFPDDLASIVGGTLPELAGAYSMEDTVLSDWMTVVDEGDVIQCYVDATDTIAKLSVVLNIERS